LISFVVLKTIQHVEDIDEDPTDRQVLSEHTGEVAAFLVIEGWFTQDEYINALAHDEVEDIDEELWNLDGDV
jgi:hypothetical protein